MRRVAEHDTTENRRALFALLLDATLTAAAVDNPPPGAEQGLAMLEGKDGPVLPVFTGTDALRAWRATGYTPMAVPGRTLFEMAARHDTARIEMNPASVPRGWISRTEIAALSEGRIPVGRTEEPAQPSQHSRQKPSQAKVGRPAVRPAEALIESARRALDSQPDAVAGRLFLIAEGKDAPHADQLRFMLIADRSARRWRAAPASSSI